MPFPVSDLLTPSCWVRFFSGVIGVLPCIENRLILAGSTQNSFSDRFGIVIFWANGEKSARDFMNDDPVVKFGMMDAELFPYAVYKCNLVEHGNNPDSLEN